MNSHNMRVIIIIIMTLLRKIIINITVETIFLFIIIS